MNVRGRIFIVGALVWLAACQSSRLRSLIAVPNLLCADAAGGPPVDCTTINFGDVPVGTTVVRDAFLADIGTAALTVSGTSWQVGSDSSFSDVFDIIKLQIGQQESFQVSFTPTHLGAVTGTFVVLSQGGAVTSSSLKVLGAGTGEATPQLSAMSVNFGNVLQNTTATQTVNLSNSGNVAMTVLSAVTSLPVFGVTAPSSPVGSAASAPLTLTYSPTMAESDSGTATLTVQTAGATEASPQTLTIQLTGESEPQILVTPGAVSFPMAAASSSSMQTVTISNVGKANLDLLSAALEPTSSAYFTATPSVTLPVTIAPAASQTVTVVYDTVGKTTDTTDTGTLVITSNDPDPTMATVDVPITGDCPTCNAPDPGCNMTYPHRLWPVGADVSTCTEGNGPLNTTGPGAEDWFSYAGCGVQRDFSTTPGSEISVITHGDGCACGGCVLWHIDYVLEENTGSGFQVEDTVMMPDSTQCPSTGEVNNTTDYTPLTNDVRLIAEEDTNGIGFYFTVCSQ